MNRMQFNEDAKLKKEIKMLKEKLSQFRKIRVTIEDFKDLINDEKRTEYLEQYGIKVIRISNLDVLKNFDGVCQYIDNVVKQSLSQLR